MKFPQKIWWWNIVQPIKFLNTLHTLLGCKIDLGKLKTIHKSVEMRRKWQFGKHFWGTLITSQDTRTWTAIIIKNIKKKTRERIKKNNHKFVNLVFMLLPQLNCANLANAQKYLHILFDSFTSRRLASYHSPSVPLCPSHSFRPHASCPFPFLWQYFHVHTGNLLDLWSWLSNWQSAGSTLKPVSVCICISVCVSVFVPVSCSVFACARFIVYSTLLKS